MGAHPAEGVLHVLQDGREFDFRSEAIVDGHQHVAGREVLVTLGGMDPPAVAKDQGAPMDPHECRAPGPSIRHVHIGVDLARRQGLVGYGVQDHQRPHSRTTHRGNGQGVDRRTCRQYTPVLAALLIRALEERGRIAGGSARAALTAAWNPCRERLLPTVSSCGTDSRGGADDRSGQHRLRNAICWSVFAC